MCGIVGAAAGSDVVPVMLESLRRMAYRGYDSAGLVVQADDRLVRARAVGRIEALEAALEARPVSGLLGIGHTRWATHGPPVEANAHPHISCDTVAVVHNGIIENHEALRETQKRLGYRFESDTDTEVIGHQIHHHLEVGMDLIDAVRTAVSELVGAFALAVVSRTEPGRLVVARRGSPLLIGVAEGGRFVASDINALLPVTRRYIALEDGDVASLTRDSHVIHGADGETITRPIRVTELTPGAVDKGPYRHFMLKEMFEQPAAIASTLDGRISGGRVFEEAFGDGAGDLFARTERVHIIACGTSYHAGLIARYWLESLTGISCTVEVASEFRYRRPVVQPGTLIVTVSQSGETADTLAALRAAAPLGFIGSLAICNVPESSLVRESDLVMMTRAGPEIGVASTKAFTTQLVALLLMVLALGRRHGLDPTIEADIVEQLVQLPGRISATLALSDEIERLSHGFADKQHALFLGRGSQYPVAMEGALKLKEISYIHAEAYPAGELKHGPLALVDANMPVVAVAPNNDLLERVKSNIQEVRARGGRLIVFADAGSGLRNGDGIQVIDVAPTNDCVAPIVYTVPLQLLAYHVAVIKGTDIDQPRNLAKAVTVE